MPFDYQGYIRALEQRDAERMLSFFADDVEIWAEDEPRPIRGKETLRRFAAVGFEALSEVKVEPLCVLQDERSTAMLVDIHASYGADVPFGGVRLELEGRHLHTKAAVFFDVDEQGRITRVRRVRDNWSAMRQLGISPQQFETLRQQMEQTGMGPEAHA